MVKEINWNTGLVVLVIGVVGILLLSNSGILTGAFSKDITGAWGSGSGVPNYIAKWSGSGPTTTALTRSILIYDNDFSVGVGVNTPHSDNKLEVARVIGVSVPQSLTKAQIEQDLSSLYIDENIFYANSKWNRFNQDRGGAQIRLTAPDRGADAYGNASGELRFSQWNANGGLNGDVFVIDKYGDVKISRNLDVDGLTLNTHSLYVSGSSSLMGDILYLGVVEQRSSNAKYLCITDYDSSVFKSPVPCGTT